MCGHANFPFIFSHMHVGVHVCVGMCVHVSMCVWKLEGNLRCHPYECYPCLLKQNLSLAWNSLCRLDRLSSEPGNPLVCVSQELRFQVLGIFIWTLKNRFCSLCMRDKCLTEGAIPSSFFF